MLYLMILAHFVSDFLLQTRRMGKEKSENENVLFMHIAIVFLCFLPFGWLLSLANAMVHMLIDRHIWRAYKWYAKRSIKNGSPLFVYGEYKYWEDKWFYTTIGFDQTLHILTIAGLYQLFS
jgi:hypothetical protein